MKIAYVEERLTELRLFNDFDQNGSIKSMDGELKDLRNTLEKIGLEADERVERIEQYIRQRLSDGVLIAKGYRVPFTHGAAYVLIRKTEWLLLHMNFENNSAEGHGVKYLGLQLGKVGSIRGLFLQTFKRLTRRFGRGAAARIAPRR